MLRGPQLALAEQLAWTVQGTWCECASPDSPCDLHRSVEKAIVLVVEAMEEGLNGRQPVGPNACVNCGHGPDEHGTVDGDHGLPECQECGCPYYRGPAGPVVGAAPCAAPRPGGGARRG